MSGYIEYEFVFFTFLFLYNCHFNVCLHQHHLVIALSTLSVIFKKTIPRKIIYISKMSFTPLKQKEHVEREEIFYSIFTLKQLYLSFQNYQPYG